MAKLSDNFLWELIEDLKWTSDHNYSRVSLDFSLMNATQQKEVKAFADRKMEELDCKFQKAWLADPGINVSDDGWSDLRAEVVGRGKKFFESVTVKKLQSMANSLDYHENFIYGLSPVKNIRLLEQYQICLNNIKGVEGAKYNVKSEKHRLLYTYYLELEMLYKMLLSLTTEQ